MKLKESKVYFEERDHSYVSPEGKKLSGITSLIHSVLRLGVYPSAGEYVKQVTIPKAGYYGSCVHQSILIYDTLGIEATKYAEQPFDTKDYGEHVAPSQDVRQELDSYIEARGVRKVIGSEFLVSYGSYATQIDSIWQSGRNIILVDFKTNNLDYYPGGEEGLKEYLSWQLSCCAYMFEQQTGKKVKELFGLWLRGDKKQLWKIERQPDEQVKALLETELVEDENGKFTYINTAMQREDNLPVVANTDSMPVPIEVITAISDLLRAEKVAKEMKEKLRSLMEQNGITKWECDAFTATIGKPSVKKKFDEKSFRRDNPDLYEGYLTEVESKGAFRITSK